MYRFALITLFILSLSAIAFAQTDIRIRKQSQLSGAQLSPEMLAKLPAKAREQYERSMLRESTVYIKGSRKRTDIGYEYMSGYSMKKGTSTLIDQCDKQQSVSYRTDQKKYTVEQFGGNASSGKSRGSVTVTVKGTDTGERMQLFGFTAKRIKQEITFAPSADSCMPTALSMQVDGWYADVPTFSCPFRPDASGAGVENNGCTVNMKYNISGVSPTGVALKETRTITSGGNAMTFQEEVIDLQRTVLDPSLFEIPQGYAATDSLPSNNPNSSSQQQWFDPTADAAAATGSIVTSGAAPPAKKAGAIRIGIVAPMAEMGQEWNGGDTVSAVRNTMSVALNGEKIETVIIESGLPEQEAKQKQCDFVLHTKVTRKKGGGGFLGAMGPMLIGAAAGMIPGVGGIVGSIAASTIMATTISGGFKSKDEVGFEYRLDSAAGMSVIPVTASKQKAKKDGEDVLTPQISKAAETIKAKILVP